MLDPMDGEVTVTESGAKPAQRVQPGWVDAVVNYAPLAAFFLAYEFAGLKAATIVVIAATLLALGFGWVVSRRFAAIPAVTAVIVGVLGGLTLWLNDPDFIKLKPTIVYLLFAGVVGVELASGRKLLVDAMLAAAPKLAPRGRRALMLRFLVFFLAMALVNEIARRVLSTDHWVLWKVPGAIAVTLLFGLAQVPLIARHRLEDESEKA